MVTLPPKYSVLWTLHDLEHIKLASRMLKKEEQTPEITKTTSQKKHQV